MSSDYEKAVDALMKDVKDLRADLRSILGAVHDRAKDSIEGAKESLRESGAERADQVKDAARAVGRKCHRAVSDCGAKIGEHPFLSVLAALGVGAVVGLLLKRRS